MQKGLDTVSGPPSSKEKSNEQRVTTEDVQQIEEKEVQVHERMSTRKARAAIKEKAKENQSTMGTVRQKVSSSVLIFKV